MNIFEQFRFGPFPQSLLDENTRHRLEEAILADDSSLFCQLLSVLCPDLVGQYRMYGVFQRGATGMELKLVDGSGRSLTSDSIIGAMVPVHILNLEFTSTGLKVTIGDHVWSAPYGDISSQTNQPDAKSPVTGGNKGTEGDKVNGGKGAS